MNDVSSVCISILSLQKKLACGQMESSKYWYAALLLISHLVLPKSGLTSGLALTHCRLNELPHTILEDSNFDFRLCKLDIPRENWLNYSQTVKTLIRRRVLRRLIWVCTVCQLPF